MKCNDFFHQTKQNKHKTKQMIVFLFVFLNVFNEANAVCDVSVNSAFPCIECVTNSDGCQYCSPDLLGVPLGGAWSCVPSNMSCSNQLLVKSTKNRDFCVNDLARKCDALACEKCIADAEKLGCKFCTGIFVRDGCYNSNGCTNGESNVAKCPTKDICDGLGCKDCLMKRDQCTYCSWGITKGCYKGVTDCPWDPTKLAIVNNTDDCDAREMTQLTLPPTTTPLPTTALVIPTDSKGCLVYPAKVDLPLNCQVSLATWAVACGGNDTNVLIVPPGSSKPTAILNLLNIKLNRCPSPELTINATYTLDISLPFGIDSVLKSMNIEIPKGLQQFGISKKIEQGGEIEIAIVPQTGIVSVSALGSTYKFGVALVLTNISVVSASASFNVAFRVCALQSTCTDAALLTNLAFGDPKANVCCLDKSLLCDSEKAMCAGNSPSSSFASKLMLNAFLYLLSALCFEIKSVLL